MKTDIILRRWKLLKEDSIHWSVRLLIHQAYKNKFCKNAYNGRQYIEQFVRSLRFNWQRESAVIMLRDETDQLCPNHCRWNLFHVSTHVSNGKECCGALCLYWYYASFNLVTKVSCWLSLKTACLGFRRSVLVILRRVNLINEDFFIVITIILEFSQGGLIAQNDEIRSLNLKVRPQNSLRKKKWTMQVEILPDSQNFYILQERQWMWKPSTI